LYNKDKTILHTYPAGKIDKSFTIPNGITSIGVGAFSACTKLTNITIPNGVTNIEEAAFSNCTSLVTINVEVSNSAYTSENGVLYNKNKTVLHTYPAGKTDKSFTIPNTVTGIGFEAFLGCASLASVTIPNSVTTIGPAAFSSCTSLTSITIPNSVTTIENYNAFWGCTSLTSLVIGNKVTSIGGGSFHGCTSLASVTIPNSVTSIGDQAFLDCASLTSVRFEGTIASGNFSSNLSFHGDLRAKYLAGGIGWYTRASGSSEVWTKQ
jgi:hypothetical protein